MMCAIHGKQTIAEKMKADLDEMKENADKELRVPEKYLEVFTESPTKKPEVPAPTQAEMEKKWKKLCKSEQRELDAVCHTICQSCICSLEI